MPDAPKNMFPNVADPVPPAPEPAPSVPWYKDGAKVLLVIAALGGLLSTAGQVVNSVITNWNHKETKDTQAVIIAKTDEAALKAEDAAKLTAVTKETVAAKAAVTDAALKEIKVGLDKAPAATAAEVKKMGGMK